MFTSKIKTYDIDLALPENKRWDEVIESEADAAKKLVDEAVEEIQSGVPDWMLSIGGWAINNMYHLFGGRYRQEIQAWADAFNLPMSTLTMLNCSYELSHVFGGEPYGCTAGVMEYEDELIHVRNMDWPLYGIGEVTRLFHFQGRTHNFTTVGIPGFIGALSGMVHGKRPYSVTLNWAPPDGLPSFDMGPAFLLREVFETCRTIGEAIELLCETPLSAPVFFVVCGDRAFGKNAVVIERLKGQHHLRSGMVVTQANHFHHFKRYNGGVDEGYSIERETALMNALVRSSPEHIEDCLDVDPVLNENTQQQMVFRILSDKMEVWRWEDR
jgi:predicted choloylglycine hydrolase